MQTKRRMRHAFLITAHRDRGQLTDLVDVLATDSSHVFVHLDRKASFPPRKYSRRCGGRTASRWCPRSYACSGAPPSLSLRHAPAAAHGKPVGKF